MKKFCKFIDNLNFNELALLVISMVLIAIWPMRDTIAARNILLVLCTLISFFYLYKNFIKLIWNQKQSIKNWMPIILVALLFIWVLIHYFFFSRDPAAQLKELSSIWARSLMAGITGFTLGLIINRRGKGYGLIMLALISGLLIVLLQYLVLVLQTGDFFHSMLWNSVYWGKMNQVLIGTLFLSGSLAYFDNFIGNDFQHSQNPSSWMLKLLEGSLYILGVAVVFHCYVFEIDTRNGIGIAAILIVIFGLKSFYRAIKNKFWLHNWINMFKTLSILAMIFLVIIIFGIQHIKRNSGWITFLEDVKIASQVEKYPNWQTSPSSPTVYSETGRPITPSTYERVAWMIVAVRTIDKYPLGYGLVHNAFRHLVKIDYPKSDLTISHSGWLDLGLSFGVIGATLALGSLLWTLVLSICSHSCLAPRVLWSAFALFLVYGLLEIIYYHGVEILIFWLSFLPALLFPKKLNIS